MDHANDNKREIDRLNRKKISESAQVQRAETLVQKIEREVQRAEKDRDTENRKLDEQQQKFDRSEAHVRDKEAELGRAMQARADAHDKVIAIDREIAAKMEGRRAV